MEAKAFACVLPEPTGQEFRQERCSLRLMLAGPTDFHVEAIDLLSNQVPCEAGIALVVALYSAKKDCQSRRGPS